MPESPRAVSVWVISFVLEGIQNPILIYKERAADADVIVRRAIQVRAWWVKQQWHFSAEVSLPPWPKGAHGDLDVPGWMLPYVAEIVSDSGPSLAVRGFLDLRLVVTCAVMRTEMDPSQLSLAPFKE